MPSVTTRRVDAFLRGRSEFRPGRTALSTLYWLLGAVVVFGGFYGVVMVCFTGLAPGRWHQLLYSGIKTPMLLLLIYGLCVPTFFVLNSVFGLRTDTASALLALTAMQSCFAIVLACLAPVLALVYVSIKDYPTAVLFNGILFAAASFASQIVVFRYYRPLIRRDPRHRKMLGVWLALYVFVGIQAAWVMRPFIGNPGVPVAFLRPGAWGNAYVAILDIFKHVSSLPGTEPRRRGTGS